MSTASSAPTVSFAMILGDLACNRDTRRPRANSASARLSKRAATVLGIALLPGFRGHGRRFTVYRCAFGSKTDWDLGGLSDRAPSNVYFLDEHQRLFDNDNLLHDRDDRGVA